MNSACRHQCTKAAALCLLSKRSYRYVAFLASAADGEPGCAVELFKTIPAGITGSLPYP